MPPGNVEFRCHFFLVFLVVSCVVRFYRFTFCCLFCLAFSLLFFGSSLFFILCLMPYYAHFSIASSFHFCFCGFFMLLTSCLSFFVALFVALFRHFRIFFVVFFCFFVSYFVILFHSSRKIVFLVSFFSIFL